MRNISLDAFVKNEQARLAGFKEHHKKGNAQNPEQWPMELQEGVWWELFMIFAEDVEVEDVDA